MSVLARRRPIMGSIVQPKRSCLGLSRCCHVLVTVHAGASQGYVLGIPLYPTGRSSTWTGPFGLGLGLGLGLAHSCMYCDQPSLLTRDPGGGANKEIPHRWGKQPHRLLLGCGILLLLLLLIVIYCYLLLLGCGIIVLIIVIIVIIYYYC